jgi:hypothetical protein
MDNFFKLLLFPIVLFFSFISNYVPEFSTKRVPCVFNTLFDFECWGCGKTRAINALLHGELNKSFRFHRLSVFVLCVIAFISIKEIFSIGQIRKIYAE